MEKQEFLEKLSQALIGRVTPGEVAENVKFYEDYINVEIRKGKSEEEVLAQLGDPRLIAKTIVETSGGNQKSGKDTVFGRGSSRSGYGGGSAGDEGAVPRRFRIPGWMILILLLVVIVLVLSVVFSVVTALLPVLLPILAVVFLVKLFRDWLN